MRFAILIALVVVALLLLAWAVVRLVSGPRRALPAPPGRDPAAFRNHQLMARTLDSLLDDDYVSGVIREEKKREMRSLLAEFYDNPSIEGER